MDTLYKYCKSINNFIHLPTIKLAVPDFFNDPFEIAVSKEISDLLDNEEPEAIAFDMGMEISKIGIVSLSETSRNLLMWAHYADEHRGICIGFDSEVLSELELGNIHLERYHSLSPVKVNYDNLRVDIKELLKDQDFIYENSILKMLTTKSDEWIYEKEHRCIVPIGWSDIAYSKGRNIKVKAAIEKYFSDSTYICEQSDEIITTQKEVVFEELTPYSGMVFLKKINPLSVKSIYLGCKYNENEAMAIANTLKNPTHPLHHIELYKYRLSKTRFELEEQLLHPSIPIRL